MIRVRQLLAVLIGLGLLATACGNGSSPSEDAGADAGAAELIPTADGGQIDLGSLEGTDTILWFWAPW